VPTGTPNTVPLAPQLDKKWTIDDTGKQVPRMNPVTGQQEDPLGFLGHTRRPSKSGI